MPGIKRRSSGNPPKLKKPRTFVTVTSAEEEKNVPADSLDSPPILEKISVIDSPRKKASPGKKSPEKKFKMPRFPTLKPTKPKNDGDEKFSFSTPLFYSNSPASSNFTKLKKDTTLKLNDKVSENKLNNEKGTNLASETTEILPPQLEIEVDPSLTRASEIERKMQKLPSGSIVGKITNLEFDDLVLPMNALDIVYEFSDESSTSTYGASKITCDGLQPRASAFDVAEYLTSIDNPNSEKIIVEEPIPKIEEEASEITEKEEVGTDQQKMDENEIKNSSDEDSDKQPEPQEENKHEVNLSTNETASPIKTPRKVPGGLREIVFSFDTTGSMYSYMEEAGERIKDLVNRLQTDMTGIRLAFMAHGDYYDLSHDRYLIKWIDFGASIEEVVKFFENLSITHGGDDDECYELVLRKTRESLSWTPGSQRSLVLIGDSDPHEPGYKYEQFVNDIDWRVETALLKEMGVRIYGLQVGYRSDFYKQISKITGGAHLRIDNASFTYETLMSICLREGSLKLLKSYENEVRKAKKNSEEGGILDLELERLFSSLKSVEDNKSTKTMLKEQKLALKEEKKAKRALEMEAKMCGGEGSPTKKLKIDKKSPLKVSNKFKNAATAKILSKAKRTIIEKKLSKTSPVNKGLKVEDGQKEETNKSKVLSKVKVKKQEGKEMSSSMTPPKSAKKSLKSDKGIQNESGKKRPGRPPKAQNEEGKKKPGRPPKGPAVEDKKKPGRPSKVRKEEKKKPGRPSKVHREEKKEEKKKPGRPPKEEQKKPGRPPKNQPPGKELKSKAKENANHDRSKNKKNNDVKSKSNESKKTKPAQSKKPSPAAKKSPGKITKTKVVARVGNKKAELLKKSVKNTTGSTVKKQEKTQVSKKSEKSKPANKTKPESKIPKEGAQKTQKTPKKSPKASSKVSKPVKKQPREAAPVTKFVMGPLSALSWDTWMPLITHTKPDVKTEDWKKKPSVSPGFCNDKVYNSETPQAVYEIAVSPPDSTKRYPVFYAVDALWSCFSSAYVKKEVERVIKAKGSISVRKGSMGKPNDAVFQKAVDFMKVNFDYAWDGRGVDVKKDGFIIAKAS